MMNEEIATEVATSLQEGAQMIAKERRNIISQKSIKLAGLISCSNIIYGNSGKVVIKVGYSTEAIKEAPEAFVMEFGKPSKDPNRGNRAETGNIKTIAVTTKRGTSYNMHIKEKAIRFKNGRKLDTLGRIIGYVAPIPHIRKGWDKAITDAHWHTVRTLEKVIERFGRRNDNN